MSTTTRSRSLADRLSEAISSRRDLDGIAGAVFALLPRWIPFEFACLASTDPATGLITTAVKSRPLPVGDEEFAAAEYGPPDLLQLTEIAERPVPVGALSLETDGHPELCRRFREYMAPQFDFTDELRMICRAQNTVWAALALYRGPGEPPFSAKEARTLGSVHEVIAQGIRRVLFTDPPRGRTERTPAVLIIDSEDRVEDTSAAAAEVIDELGGWYGRSIPSSLSILAASARTKAQPVKSRIRARSGNWLSVQALPLGGVDGSGSVVLTVETAAQAAVGEMALAARGLTAREQEVVALVLQGASTKDIAATLHLSPHTVQDHLKAVFDKLDVNSRRELIAQFVP